MQDGDRWRSMEIDGDRAADGSTSRACLERVEGGEPVLLARSRTAGRRLIVLGDVFPSW